jgi:hypothetical protein
LFGKAGDGAFVADKAVAFDHYSEDDCVVVAVGGCGDDAEAVAAGFTLHPELLAGAAPEGNEAGFEALGVADRVEEAKHEDFAGGCVLDDAWDQAVHFGEIDLRGDRERFGRERDFGHGNLLFSLELVEFRLGRCVSMLPAKSEKPAGV